MSRGERLGDSPATNEVRAGRDVPIYRKALRAYSLALAWFTHAPTPTPPMKNKLPCFVLGLLSVSSAVFGSSSSSSASVVSVSASQAIRIALVDTGERRGAEPGVEQVFAPYLTETISRLHGARAEVQVVAVSGSQAARGLQRGKFDAALVLGSKAPKALRRPGYHMLTGESLLEERDSRVFLVLRKEEARLDALMANAFTLALSEIALRRTLVERLHAGQALTAVDR